MKKTDLITQNNAQYLDADPELFIARLNTQIRNICRCRGRCLGTKLGADQYMFVNKNFALNYLEFPNGKERFTLYVNTDTWDNIPPEIPEYLCRQNGEWNLVYDALFTMENTIVYQYIPGEWADLFAIL